MKKRYLFPAVAALLLAASCGESADSKAGRLLQEATAAFSAGEYQSAKILIDSIRNSYPKAFDARRGALELMREVELAEQQRTLDYCNEMIASLSAQRDSLLPSFEFEKNSRYQDEGSYIVPSQANRVNVFNSLLRARVTESGVLYLTSLYRGKKISHTSVKVLSGESYASCDKPFSSHTYRNLGINNERLDFIYGEDGGMVDYISSATGSVTVQLIGAEGTYKYTLRKEDAKAIADVASLARILKSIAGFREMAAEAERHIDFVKKTRERFSADTLKSEQ